MKKRAGPDAVDIHVGNRIKMQRRIIGMSQTTLADGIGLTFQQVQKYENGKNRVSSSRLQQISELLGVPVAFFFEGAEKVARRRAPDYLVDLANAPGGIQLAKAFNRIENKRTRRSIVDLVEMIADTPEANAVD